MVVRDHVRRRGHAGVYHLPRLLPQLVLPQLQGQRALRQGPRGVRVPERCRLDQGLFIMKYFSLYYYYVQCEVFVILTFKADWTKVNYLFIPIYYYYWFIIAVTLYGFYLRRMHIPLYITY